MTSQIVVRGKYGASSASDYHQRRVEELFPIVCKSYETLASQYDIVILEGAGSPAEINLKQHDIVNMRMAAQANAVCILVGDIDREGVLASLLGTVELLEPAKQQRIRGFIINKFRGDISLLESGIRMMEDRLQKPCLGVIPYLPDLILDEEDSLGLPADNLQGRDPWLRTTKADEELDRPLRVAVVALPSFSNFTDFDALRDEPSVSLRFCRNAMQLGFADVVILPGSKQTADDLIWLRKQGLEFAVRQHALHGLTVGICGGMQMLGRAILDDDAIERRGETKGLGLLPFLAQMNSQKITRQASGSICTAFLFEQKMAQVNVNTMRYTLVRRHIRQMLSPYPC